MTFTLRSRRLSAQVRFAAAGASLVVIASASRALAWDGSQSLEAGLDPQQVLLFEDFEAADYASKWPVYWGSPVGAGTVTSPASYVFAGSASAYLQGQAAEHDSLGSGEYVPTVDVGDVAYARLYLRFEDGFSMGTCNQLKLFDIRGGSDLSETYGHAGEIPTGTDRFSGLLAIDTAGDLHFYYYHPDQQDVYGDITNCDASGSQTVLSAGQWYCIELGLKANAPGQTDGSLRAWVDGTLVGQVDGLRFRDTTDVKIQRFSVINYYGGSGQENTAPQDQRTFVDNYVVSRAPIGCLGAPPPDGGLGGSGTGGGAGAATGGGGAGGGSGGSAAGAGGASGGTGGAGATSGSGGGSGAAGSGTGGSSSSGDDGGCGCRMLGARSEHREWLVLAALGACLGARRRTRRRG